MAVGFDIEQRNDRTVFPFQDYTKLTGLRLQMRRFTSSEIGLMSAFDANDYTKLTIDS